MSKNKRLLEFEDIRKIAYLAAPTATADGKNVVFVKLFADEKTGDFIPHIYEVNTDSKQVEKLVNLNNSTEDRPLFSPDGTKLAYISTSSGEKQVWIIELKNNKYYQLTTLRHGVSNFVWSFDSKKIAFETHLWTDEAADIIFNEMSAEEKTEWNWNKENMPLAVEELMYKFDESYGIADGSYRQIGIINVETKETKIITKRSKHFDTPSWSHDGQNLVCFGFPYGHNKATKKEVFIINVQTEDVRQLTTDQGYKESFVPLFTKDDKHIIYAGLLNDSDKFVSKPIKVPATGGDRVVVFPEEEICHGVMPYTCGKTAFGKCNSEMQLSECGKYLYFISSWQGYTHIYKMNLEGQPQIEQITKGNISVRTFCAPVDNKLIYMRGDLSTIDEIYCLDLLTKTEKRLTYSNDWLNDVIISLGEEIWVESKDKTAKIHGWFVMPANLDKNKKYPIVLDIHGGPEVCYTAGWWHEFQMLSASGIAVAYCDPRGSVGFGSEYLDDDFSWGDAAYDDLLTFLEAVEEKYPYVNADKEGITGGSYGGYMTNKFIGTTDRFKAAVTQRTFCNQATSYGTGDMGFISSIGESRPKFYDYIINRAKKSMINKVDNIKTPLLILHGTLDYRCSYEQSEQMFVAMKERNPQIPIRMVAFPGENHGITRTGKIHFQIRHLKEMVEWFNKYLCDKVGNVNE